jgi:hypothetical protein
VISLQGDEMKSSLNIGGSISYVEAHGTAMPLGDPGQEHKAKTGRSFNE